MYQCESLIQVLRAPALAMPYSLSGQLQYILDRWGTLLGAYLARLLYRLLGALDLIKEENKLTFLGPGPASGMGKIEQKRAVAADDDIRVAAFNLVGGATARLVHLPLPPGRDLRAVRRERAPGRPATA